VISVSLGVLKSGSIKFSPTLPEWKQEAIDALQMGLMNKIVLHFPERFWGSVSRIIHISKVKGEFPWFDSISKTSPTLVGWVACDYAIQLEELSDKEIVDKAVGVLKKFFGEDKVPDPIDYFVSKWLKNPHTLGAYSIVPPGSSQEDNDALAQDIWGRLYFCGEATSPEYLGTVHGAHISGNREAEKIIDLLFFENDPPKENS